MRRKKCERCGSKEVTYNDNYITDTTVIECQDCGYIRTEDLGKEE